jgi:hypothetical protein
VSVTVKGLGNHVRKSIMRTVAGSRRIVFAFAASMIAAACTNGGSSAASTIGASLTQSASASSSTPPLVQEGGAPLGPGTYTTVFQPPITFTTDASWVSFADVPGFVYIEQPDGHGSIGFMRVDKVFNPAKAHTLMTVPRNYAGWITTLPGVKLLAGPKHVTVDGFQGTEIDVRAAEDAPTVYCKDPCVALRPLDPGHPIALSTDYVSRIIALRLHGKTIEISACCAPGAAGFAALAKDFDSVIATVHFG